MPGLRVMTYNIRADDRGGIALDEVVRAADPDVLVVNETPKTPCLWRSRVRELAERWGMRHLAGGRDAGSNMVLATSSVQVRSTYTTTLRQPLFAPRRGIVAAQLRVRGRLLGVVGCHLGLDAERRRWEVEQVLSVAARLRGPVVLGGDLNEEPHGPSWRRLREARFVDHGSADWPTFPAAEPVKRIDALLVRGEVRVLDHGSPGVAEGLLARASDHRPVLAVLDV